MPKQPRFGGWGGDQPSTIEIVEGDEPENYPIYPTIHFYCIFENKFQKMGNFNQFFAASSMPHNTFKSENPVP